ncbi:hypothetical protein HYALB_00004636 [Hymenoscyphus albidus]|uniref:Uncharacterized protein n=1 Tax=Hymenoscyphus albidus TaxID=595503 RepID=A0A9N9LYW0_9HELO|nr:hypothetical protein HYALB_00004636 [Hymenoscyphus albidus]
MISLAGLVAVRSATLRPGRTISTARPTNLEALLGQLTGQVNTPGCTHCAGGSGAWSTEGRRCSIRPGNIASAARVAAAVAAAMAAPAPAAVAQVAPHNPLRRSGAGAGSGAVRSSAASRRTGCGLAALYEEEARVLEDEDEEEEEEEGEEEEEEDS